jgi:lysozyme
MKPSQNCIDLVKKFEGCKLTAYKCNAGVNTIGYGHTLGVKLGTIITQVEAERLLMNDLLNIANSVTKLTKNVTQNQFDSLVSFAYNCGVGALTYSTLLKKVNANPNDLNIKLEFAKWNKVNGKPLLGLTKRRIAEWQLYNS